MVGAALFGGPIFVANLISELRRLNRNGIAWPVLVVIKRVLSALPLPSWRTTVLVRQRLYIAWDIRWLQAGEVMGRVLVFDPQTRALEISFDRPIPFLSVSGTELFYAGSAVFTPEASDRAAYALRSVAGNLRPDNMATSGISATIVTYPRSSTDGSAAVSRCE